MRIDQNLNPDELQKLWKLDPDRVLLEWSYRISETPAILEDPASFMHYLIGQYRNNLRGGLEKRRDILALENLENRTIAYENGKITLSDWLEGARFPSVYAQSEHGERQVVRTRLRRADPVVDASYRRVLAEHIKLGNE